MKKNIKGFTLIELLAVIVILGVLLTIAVPAVTNYINSSKKSLYKDNVLEYVDALYRDAVSENYALPVNKGDATVVTFARLNEDGALSKGGELSPYDGKFDDEQSYIVVVNEGTAEKPHYVYYVAAVDTKGYGVGKVETTASPLIINSNKITNSNIVQLGTNNGISIPDSKTLYLHGNILNTTSTSSTLTVTVKHLCTNNDDSNYECERD